MKRTIEMILMTLLLVGVAVFVGTTLTSCSLSNDDDDPIVIIDPVENPIVGYWEYTGEDMGSNPTGLNVQPDGNILGWTVDAGKYQEYNYTWGYCWVDEDGELRIKDGGKDDVLYDGMSYTIMKLTKTTLVIRSYGGFAGTPFEKGQDREYKRLKEKPGE